MNSQEQVFQQMLETAETKHAVQQEELAEMVRRFTDEQFNDLLHYASQRIIMDNVPAKHCWNAGNTIKMTRSLICLKNAIRDDYKKTDIRAKMQICRHIDNCHKSLMAFIKAHAILFLIPHYGYSKENFFLFLKTIEQKIKTHPNQQDREEAGSVKVMLEGAIPHKWLSEWRQANQTPKSS